MAAEAGWGGALLLRNLGCFIKFFVWKKLGGNSPSSGFSLCCVLILFSLGTHPALASPFATLKSLLPAEREPPLFLAVREADKSQISYSGIFPPC